MYTRLQKWLLRTLEANSLARVRRLYSGVDKTSIQVAKERDFRRQLERYGNLVQSVFDGVIKSFLPENRRGSVAEFRPIRPGTVPTMVRFNLSDGTTIDTVTPRLRQILDENPDAQPAERLQEVRCLEQTVRESDAGFLLVCPEKFIIKDQHGRYVDDWDGVQIAITDTRLTLTIVEGKTGGTAQNRENAAFRQLDATRRLLVSRHALKYRRQRISGIGAAIHLSADA
jgi:hypothetical protein